MPKKTLQEHGLSVPETDMSVSYFYELQKLDSDLRQYTSFVIKPSSGSGGNGIIVISDYSEGVWTSISGKKYNFAQIKKHIADIIFGVYSFGPNEAATMERRLSQVTTITVM